MPLPLFQGPGAMAVIGDQTPSKAHCDESPVFLVVSAAGATSFQSTTGLITPEGQAVGGQFGPIAGTQNPAGVYTLIYTGLTADQGPLPQGQIGTITIRAFRDADPSDFVDFVVTITQTSSDLYARSKPVDNLIPNCTSSFCVNDESGVLITPDGDPLFLTPLTLIPQSLMDFVSDNLLGTAFAPDASEPPEFFLRDYFVKRIRIQNHQESVPLIVNGCIILKEHDWADFFVDRLSLIGIGSLGSEVEDTPLHFGVMFDYLR